MKKVVMIVTNRYDPDIRVHKEAVYLVKSGYEVEVLCWDRENEYINRRNEVVEGVHIKRFYPFSKYGTGIRQIKSFFLFVVKVRAYLKKVDFDYIHCHDLDGVIVGQCCKRYKAKLIFDMHEIYELQDNNKKIKHLVRLIVNYYQKKSDHIIYVNEIQKQISKHNKKMIYLPNYPEKKILGSIKKTESKKIRISYIGVVRQYNEFKNLFEACKHIDNISISIHGGGVAYEKLIKLKEKYINVTISGIYDISKLPFYYRDTDIIYAVYSNKNIQHMKSYPVKFFEAIITATPIIVTKGSVLEKFVKENNIGFVVKGDNIKEIKLLIKTIVANENLINEKRKNIEKIRYKFTWEEVINNLDYIYLM